jgi:pimeloyl-ACP methyl ester carboxylesterase
MAEATPVVLVHGLLASPTLMKAMEWRLRGRPVARPSLFPLALRDVRRHAGELDLAVDRVRHRHGVEQVDVVGVSQGGLIALWWAHHLGGWPRIRRMCLIGAPVRGTWAAAAGIPVFGACSTAIWQLLPGSSLVADLARPLPPGAEVVTVSLDTDPLTPPSSCALEGADNRVLPARWSPLLRAELDRD